MTSDIIDDEALRMISGAGTRASLIAWLKTNNIPYLLARSGWPRVHRKALEQAMGVGDGVQVTGAPVQFDFAMLR